MTRYGALPRSELLACFGPSSMAFFAVEAAQALAMVVAGGVIALLVYTSLGLGFLSQSWFNLDVVWAVSLILIGGAGLIMA